MGGWPRGWATRSHFPISTFCPGTAAGPYVAPDPRDFWIVRGIPTAQLTKQDLEQDGIALSRGNRATMGRVQKNPFTTRSGASVRSVRCGFVPVLLWGAELAQRPRGHTIWYCLWIASPAVKESSLHHPALRFGVACRIKHCHTHGYVSRPSWHDRLDVYRRSDRGRRGLSRVGDCKARPSLTAVHPRSLCSRVRGDYTIRSHSSRVARGYATAVA